MPGDWIGGNRRRHNLASAGLLLLAAILALLVLIPTRTTPLPDPIETVVNDSQHPRLTLTQRDRTIEVPVARRRRAGPTTIAVRSTTTLRGAVPQGVFLEQAALTTAAGRCRSASVASSLRASGSCSG